MVTPSGVINTVAGNGIRGFSGDGGPASAATLREPAGIALDALGNLYISDSINNRIRKVTSAGIISTVAGNGSAYGANGDGGPATSARITTPYGVALDAAGNLYISDSNCYIRMVVPSGTISKVAGNGGCGYGVVGGPVIYATIDVPEGLAFAANGDLYFADSGNARVRKISQGVISTVAGLGNFTGDNGPAIDATFSATSGIALDGSGNFYIADSDRNNRIRRVSANGVVTTIAGNGGAGPDGDYDPAVYASVCYPLDSVVDAAGNLYISEYYGEKIRKVSPNGTITPLVGTGNSGSGGDGGPALSAELYGPSRMALDTVGNLYIADTFNNKVRRVGTDGLITTVAGNGTAGFAGDGGPATSA